MIHNLFDQRVSLEPVSHRYYDTDGLEYMSFSKVYGFLTEKFDAENVSFHYAKKHGMTQDEVLAKWRGQTEEGTRLDKALKLFSQTGQILQENADLEEVIYKVSEKYKKYHQCYEDVVIYSKEFRTAGEIDKLSLVNNRKDGSFVISDFKRFESDSTGLQEVKGSQKWLNYPFDHLPASKYTKISFQMSFYAYHFEMLTNRKCSRLFIDTIIPHKDSSGVVVDIKNEVVPVMYMRNEVKELLATHRTQILTNLGAIEPAF